MYWQSSHHIHTNYQTIIYFFWSSFVAFSTSKAAVILQYGCYANSLKAPLPYFLFSFFLLYTLSTLLWKLRLHQSYSLLISDFTITLLVQLSATLNYYWVDFQSYRYTSSPIINYPRDDYGIIFLFSNTFHYPLIGLL